MYIKSYPSFAELFHDIDQLHQRLKEKDTVLIFKQVKL